LGSGVQSHVVHLDSLVKLLLLEVDIAHVHSQSTGLRVLLVLQDDCVRVERLLMESVCVVHVGQVVEDVESQINVYLIEGSSVLSQLTDLLFFGCSLFGLG
jgi:hypothetical protein